MHCDTRSTGVSFDTLVLLSNAGVSAFEATFRALIGRMHPATEHGMSTTSYTHNVHSDVSSGVGAQTLRARPGAACGRSRRSSGSRTLLTTDTNMSLSRGFAEYSYTYAFRVHPINTGVLQSGVIAEPQHVVERNLIEGSEHNAFVGRRITSQERADAAAGGAASSSDRGPGQAGPGRAPGGVGPHPATTRIETLSK
ncbi:unnamed protein product [Chrysodeixis includens]|uniref:Uncharacterized protein n=1 Tax=Chrysodeixis includens TaxID=689277 RepID=A0A9N8L1K8_CHRIL|nr:unnamed protein product [Chrysodeixis includens]